MASESDRADDKLVAFLDEIESGISAEDKDALLEQWKKDIESPATTEG